MIVVLPGTSLGQSAQPSIAFLNPSSFAAAGERGIIVSDAKPEAGPGCCTDAAAGYHLSAWVANAPPGSRVFFSVTQRVIDMEITDVEPVSESTWETYWRIPAEILDGAATFYAYLVLDEVPIAVAEQPVTILRLQENVQIKYPRSGGSLGTYAALADGLTEGQAATRTAPVGVIDAHYALGPDATRVRGFYSTSLPGTPPEWKVCGTERVSGSSAGNGLRCTLGAEDIPESVTAVASVVNDGNADAPYEVRFNQSGDAVAVASAYSQQPTRLDLVTAGSQRRDRNANSGVYACSVAETFQLVDQIGRHIAGANMDAHATGPTDTLKFNNDSLSIWTDVKAPDRGAHTREAAYDCQTHPANSDAGTQGEHPRFGAPDRKHIETHDAGTNDLGRFSFQVYSTADGQTNWTVWVDEADDGCVANDDAFTDGEMAVSGVIGWSEDPGAPSEQPRESMTPCTAEPDPSESPADPDPPTEEPPALEEKLTLRAVVADTEGRRKQVRFKGLLSAAEDGCTGRRVIVLKSRKPGARFVAKQTATTGSTGHWSMSRTVKRTREWRVIARPTDDCARVKSRILKVRVASR